MKSKIEKLDGMHFNTYSKLKGLKESRIVQDNTVIEIGEKINEIIDYLNSQAQPEEKELVRQIKERYYGGDKDTPEDTTSTAKISGGKTEELASTKDTPEDYEEPEEVKCHCGKCGKEIESMNLQGEWACEECEDTPEEWKENYIKQLLLEIGNYLFSLTWFDKEGNVIMLKNIIGFDSILQIVPKRFLRLLEDKIYTEDEVQQLLDDRERETIKNFLDTTASYNSFFKGEPRKMGKEGGVKYEIVVVKLNSKKK